ncbi:hypothetical protein JCM14036_06560 [Desulfotomaculum defluvii]
MNQKQPQNQLFLSLHPDKIIKTSEAEKKLMLDEVSQLPSEKNGEKVFFDGIYCVKYEEFLQVGFYIRNYLDRPILIGNVTIKIVNDRGNVLASQEFRLVEIGQIPNRSVRPWDVQFRNENVFEEDIMKQNWKLVVEDNMGGKVYFPVISDTKPEPLNNEEIQKLKDFLKTDIPLEEDELRVIPYEIKAKDNGDLLVTLLIRSNTKKSLLWNAFGITVFNAKGQAIAKGYFDIGHNIIEAGFFFLRTFTFPADTVIINNADLSDWTIQLL